MEGSSDRPEIVRCREAGPSFFRGRISELLEIEANGQRLQSGGIVARNDRPSGHVLGLGFQLGHRMPGLGLWSREQREGALEALRSLLDAGLIQNDVRDVNFVQDDTGKVLAIDLEDVEEVPESAAKQEEYLESARKLLFAPA